MEENQIVKHSGESLQMMPMQDIKRWYDQFVQLSKEILKPNLDFGTIPGTPKPCLYKAGAEKLKFVYGLGAEFEVIEKVTQFEPMYVDYTYKCSIISKQGQILAQCDGSCNSMEEKYRFVWTFRKENPTKEEATPLVMQKIGKWIKKDDRWFFADRKDNPDIIGKKNTIMKMAQKRAFVGAVLIATGASEFFAQDLDNLDPSEEGIKKPEAPADQQQAPGEDMFVQWREALEQCKTPEDVDNLALQNKEILESNADLKKLFGQRKHKLRPPDAKQKADAGMASVKDLLSKAAGAKTPEANPPKE